MKTEFSDIHLSKLLAWFRENGQSYPWGESPDPYSVWISEIMLQQTTVSAVIPFYKKWMELYPDTAAVASAEEQEILRSWEGLGYYSRARNIHKTAKTLLLKFEGRILPDKKELLSLPGIGPYTASAILSIAFGMKEIVFDANVKRIFQRLKTEEFWTPAFQESVERNLHPLLPEHKAGTINEALMQLGQLVCRVSSPDCPNCPFNDICKAFLYCRQTDYPARKKQLLIKKETVRFCYIWDGKLYLQQKSSGVGKGLWFLPSDLEIHQPPTGNVSDITLKPYVHLYTKYRETLYPKIVFLETKPGSLFSKSGAWFKLADLDSVPVPSVYRIILNDIKKTIPE